MEKLPSKHPLGQPQDYEGLLSNLQEWELSFKEESKKIRSEVKGKMGSSAQASGNNATQLSESFGVNAKKTSPFTGTTGSIRDYDNLKDYEALSRLSTGVQSQESFLDANSEKELGNEFFKQKKFNEAIDCYSRSIALSPTAVGYANRAMAYIKIRRFQEAENDCTEALNLDDRYIKAYSRRSTARKELGKLKEAIEDAEFALRLEPQNQEIKKQYADCKSLFEKEILKKASGALTEKSKSNKAKSKASSVARVAEIPENHLQQGNRSGEVASTPVMEVKTNSARANGSHVDGGLGSLNIKPYIEKKDKQPQRASVQELAANAANLAKAKAIDNIVMPTSAYQFEVSWRGLSGDRSLQARLLKTTPPNALPGLFKNALSAPILVDMIRCIATFFTEDMALGVEYLQNLSKIPRFDMIIMCLSSADKADILRIWDEVLIKGYPDYAEILSNLKWKYGVQK